MGFQLTVFAQLMGLIDHNELNRCIERYQGNQRVRSFSCLDQFLCMTFAQLAEKRSMRDTVFSLQKMKQKLYHMGIKGIVSVSALSDANARRDWHIWHDFAQSLIPKARKLYANEKLNLNEDIANTVYAFDSTTIDLCLSLFEWAHFRKTKAGIKMHTQIDLRGSIPAFIDITEAKSNDVKALDSLIPEPGAIYLIDKGYLDFSRLWKFEQYKAFFVTRTKSNTRFKRLYSRPVDKSIGLKCDQTGLLVLKKADVDIQVSYAV